MKKLIRKKIQEHGASLFKLCKFVGVEYDRIKLWLNSRTREPSQDKLAQNEIIKLMESLGVSVRITLVVSEVSLPESVKLMNRSTRRYTKGNTVYKNLIQNEFEDQQDQEA